MIPMNGYFNENGHPVFEFKVYGHGKDWLVPIKAMFDTGFTGFLDLPLIYCLKAGLVLSSTANYVLADNSKKTTLLCLGTIVLGTGREITGTISINFSSDQALLGMDFLHKTKSKLEIDTDRKTVKIVGIKLAALKKLKRK